MDGNNKTVKKYSLGKTDCELSPVGLGCWQFSKGKGISGGMWQNLSSETEAEIVGLSLKGGVNWFDTAEIYGRGESEKALSKALESNSIKSGDVIIATKWFPMLRLAGSITRTIDERKENLSPFSIDLYQIHQPWSLSSIKKQMEKMAEIVKRGDIRYVGVSNFNAKQMRKAHKALKNEGIDLVSNQVQYSLLHRDIETNGVLETAKELGISIIAYSPLAQGILTGKFHKNPELIQKRPGWRKRMPAFQPEGLRKTQPLIDALERIGESHDASLAQVALNWTINVQGETVFVIPGASKKHHAEQNTGVMAFSLESEEIEELSSLTAS